MRDQGAENPPVFDVAVTTSHHDQIETVQAGVVLSETFPYQSFETVTVYRPANTFASNGQSQARTTTAIGSSQYRKKLITGTHRGIEYILKFGAVS